MCSAMGLEEVSAAESAQSFRYQPAAPPPWESGSEVQLRPQQDVESPGRLSAAAAAAAVVLALSMSLGLVRWGRGGVGWAGLEAGTLLAGVVGAHDLGLGHHAMLLLGEGVAICREKTTRRETMSEAPSQHKHTMFDQVSSAGHLSGVGGPLRHTWMEDGCQTWCGNTTLLHECEEEEL